MLRIVLVEDNPAEAYLLKRALRLAGVPIDLVHLEDGQKAVEYLTRSSDKCDLVLLDLNLPRLSGFEVLECLRNQDASRLLPVVVLSGSSDSGDIERSYRAGANSYIRKPVHLEDTLQMAVALMTYWSRWVSPPPR